MRKLFARFQEPAYALLRIASGFMFGFHGVQKLTGLLTDAPRPVQGQLWLGAWIEVICGAALCLGWRASLAGFLASGTMAVAYIQFHWRLQGGRNLLPAVNRGELALLYSLLFLFIAARGAGRFSLDGDAPR